MKQYIVDAFTGKPFSGNPAAVCVTDAPLPEEFMQKLLRKTIFQKRRSSSGKGTAGACAGSRRERRSICAGTRRWPRLS